MTPDVVVRSGTPSDAAACAALYAALPTWFTDDVPQKVHDAVVGTESFVVEADGELVGCLTLARRGRAAEIEWLAVSEAWHRRGLGTRLVRAAFEALSDSGVALVEAKTLAASEEYAPYVSTRAFWAAMGFVVVDEIDPMPGWQAGNPAAICVAALTATTDAR